MTSPSLALLAAAILCIPAAADQRAPVEPTSLPAPDQPVAPVKPPIEKIDENRYRVGDVIVNQKTREIAVPCLVNMDEGLLEFLLVHENGKVHESLFVTSVSPTNINLAFTLLGYKPSRHLYPIPDENYRVTDSFPDVPEDVKAAARIAIDVEWIDNGKTKRNPVNDWIQHTRIEKPMAPGPWIYGGSEFYNGKYSPEMSGDIVAIFLALSAPVNYPGKDNRDDTVWVCFADRIPPTGTKATVIFKPYKPSETK
ncbi:MAG: YdjY domain-containing protein [Verrucomicrobiales bacterium]